MFPNNSNLIEKLVHSKQDEIMREIQDINQYKSLDRSVSSSPRSLKSRAWVIVGLLTVLVWLFSVML